MSIRTSTHRNGFLSGNKKIALPTMEGIEVEQINEITHLKAEGNYTVLHFEGGRKLMVCRTLREIEELILPATEQFIRIHRSFTVNLDKVKRYLRGKGGQVEMISGETLTVSVSKKQPLMDALNAFFC